MLYTEAQEILKGLARSFGEETVSLENALGRVLTEKIEADRDYPPFNRAAMDGYAFRYEDFQKGIREYKIVETIYAGQEARAQLDEGTCYKIMTGAATPVQADVIARREDAEEKAGNVRIMLQTVKPFQNIAKQGEDILQHAVILDRPALITPPVISLLAAIGKSIIRVARRPVAAIITTGNEVVPVHAPVQPVQIRNSNSALLQSMLAKEGITPLLVDHVPDDKELLKQSFEKAMTADLVIASGGVSAGDADYVPAVLESLGVQKCFHKLQIRPGKPVWCGQAPNKAMVFALPGNPLSCMVTFMLLVRTWLQACYGLPIPAPVPLTLRKARSKKNSLDEFFPVRWVPGTATLETISFNGSGDIRAALQADGIALHPAGKERLEEGEVVGYWGI
jgi:molybdopterin molybdotransferase